MLWMCIWMCPHHVMAAHVYQVFGILLQIWASLSWYVMVKWVDWGYRPNPYSSHIHIIYVKVFDNLDMLLMCIWMFPHHVRAAHVDQAFGILPQIWASLSWYVMVKWGDWGCRPNPYSSHIHIIYVKVVWQLLYAVDVHMNVSTPCYGRSCWQSVLNFATNLGKSQLMWWWNEVIEAVDPTHIHLTSILYI
jgi:hypothetical protein